MGYQFVLVVRLLWDVAFEVHATLVVVCTNNSSKRIQQQEQFCRHWTFIAYNSEYAAVTTCSHDRAKLYASGVSRSLLHI